MGLFRGGSSEEEKEQLKQEKQQEKLRKKQELQEKNEQRRKKREKEKLERKQKKLENDKLREEKKQERLEELERKKLQKRELRKQEESKNNSRLEERQKEKERKNLERLERKKQEELKKSQLKQERIEKIKQEKHNRDQLQLENLLGKFNVFKGIECDIILPEKQLKISGSSATKKGVATLAFGIVGWAATSGTSQNEENRVITTIFQIVENGVVLKNGSMDGSDIRISFSEIIEMELLSPKREGILGVITLLKNKKILFTPKRMGEKDRPIYLSYISEIINENACGAQNEEAGWGLDYATKKLPNKAIGLNSSSINDLEILGGMYEKGLITDEEFSAIKERLIENMIDDSLNYCKECGAELYDESVFCSNCGTKIDSDF